jgi:hypothetical protein
MKKTNLIFALSVLLTGILVMGCSAPAKPITVTIKYQLTGSMEAVNRIEYKNETGGSKELRNVSLPWETSFSVTIEPDKYYYASLYGSSGRSGTLTAKLFVDGKEEELKTGESEGSASVRVDKFIYN